MMMKLAIGLMIFGTARIIFAVVKYTLDWLKKHREGKNPSPINPITIVRTAIGGLSLLFAIVFFISSQISAQISAIGNKVDGLGNKIDNSTREIHYGPGHTMVDGMIGLKVRVWAQLITILLLQGEVFRVAPIGIGT